MRWSKRRSAEPEREPDVIAPPFTEENVRLITPSDIGDPPAAGERAVGTILPGTPVPVPPSAAAARAQVGGGPGGPAERSSGRAPSIVIEVDDDLDAAVDPSPVSPSPSMDPRLRRRRQAVERAAGRRRVVLFLGIAGVVVLLVGALAVLASPIFAVRDFDVTGAVYTTQDELQPILDAAKGKAILTLDTDEIARQLQQLPWVRRASVQTGFPHTLHVQISERIPAAAYVGSDRQWRVLDLDGHVIAVIPDGAQPAAYLPIDGQGPDLAAGTDAGATYRLAAELATSMPPELRNIVAAVLLKTSGELGLRLTSGTVVTFGPATDLRNKLATTIVLLRKFPPSTLASIDVTDPGNPATTPR
jgi:cell division protein FtsQ